MGVPTGVFKNDYYGKPPSRTERFRASVRSREANGAREARDTPRYATGRQDVSRDDLFHGETPAGGDDVDHGDADAPHGLPTRGPQP